MVSQNKTEMVVLLTEKRSCEKKNVKAFFKNQKEVLNMGFDQKAMKLVGKKVEVKMFNGSIISGTMTHVSKGYICFMIHNVETEVEKKPSYRRLSLKDITSMVESK